jgi:hypothetical protein
LHLQQPYNCYIWVIKHLDMVATGTVGQRFTQLIAHLGISKNAFASSLDKTATVIQHIVDERNKPGFDLLCKVFEVYPNVSKDWLLQGTGSMLTTGSGLSTEPAPATPTAWQVAKVEPKTPTANLLPAPEPVATRAVVEAAVTAEPTFVAAPTLAMQSLEPLPIPAAPTAAPAVAPVAAPTAPAPAPVSADASWQTALYTQQMAHQLAMAELRNQHLQEQQRMMQQMMDLMKQQMFK